ncbi:MAG: amidohydrolase family protein [bacterium]|nr:amidohydrolase family protein [bacterium]
MRLYIYIYSKRILLIASLLFALVLFPGHAYGGKKKALVGGTLINGLGSTPVQNSVILVNGDKIEKVGNTGNLPVPQGYEIISTEAMTVMPGLWDMHVHLMINGHADYDHWDKAYPGRFRDEIMPASAVQLLLAGVTTARDLGAPLEDSIVVKKRIESGKIPGPRLFVSGPFIQHKPYPGTEAFRWGVNGAADGREKVRRLAKAGVDVIKLIDQDEMTLEEAQAVVDEAHKHGLKVVAHSHRPDEIRRGLAIGVDNFEHTGLTTSPEYPEDIIKLLKERTATGRIRGGPLYWTPTVEGLWNYEYVRDNPEELDTDCWHRGLKPDTIADIKQSIARPAELLYFQLTPRRRPTLKRKFTQLRNAGIVLLIGTDSGVPLKFHCQSTWNELDVWVRIMGVPSMETIQAATYWPSKFMGVEEKWGTVMAGKYADIIAVKGDVLKYINLLQHVDFVMKGGVVYKQNGVPVEESLR